MQTNGKGELEPGLGVLKCRTGISSGREGKTAMGVDVTNPGEGG